MNRNELHAPISLISERFAQWLDGIEATDDTRDTYEHAITLFLVWANDLKLITPEVFREWRNSLIGAPTTINLYLSVIRSFYGWCADQGYIDLSPLAGIKGLKRPGANMTYQRDGLTADEVRKVMSMCGDSQIGIRDCAIIVLMAYAGLRTIEVYRADMVDLRTRGDRRILWVHGKGHTSKDDFVVISSIANEYLNRWLANRPKEKASSSLFISLSNRSFGDRLSRSAIRRLVKHYFELANIVDDRKTTHSLRHSAITFAIRGGATPIQAQKFARHIDPKTTMKYYHELDRTEAPAEDLISYEKGKNDNGK